MQATLNTPAPSIGAAPRFGWVNFLTALLLILSLTEAWSLFVVRGLLHANDFKHLWVGAYLLDLGRSPYDPALLFKAARSHGLGGVNPYVYLPTTGLLMRPLAWLPFPVAMLAWFWFNWALAWLIVLWGPRLLRVERPAMARLAGAAFLAGAFPFFRQMTAGQMNVVTAALILWAAAMLIRRRPLWVGLALGLGVAWKIAPALLVAALAPLRRWRAAAWGIFWTLILFLASIIFLGWPLHREAIPILRQMGYGQSTWAQYGMDFYRDPFNQAPNSLFHHLLTANPYTQPWIQSTPRVANLLTLAVSLLLGGLWLLQAWRLLYRKPTERGVNLIPRGGAPQAEVTLFLAASLAMLLLPSLMWDHYAVQALPALLWLAGRRQTTRSLPRALGALAIFIALAIPFRHAAPEWTHGPGILLMSLRLWPMLALYFWLLFDRELQKPGA